MMLLEVTEKEKLMLYVHMSIMRKSIKKTIKKNYKQSYKKHMHLYDSLIEMFKTEKASTDLVDQTTECIKFENDNGSMLLSFFKSYIPKYTELVESIKHQKEAYEKNYNDLEILKKIESKIKDFDVEFVV